MPCFCWYWIGTMPQIRSYKSVYYWHSAPPSTPSYIYCNGCLLTWNSASGAGIAAAVYFLLLVETTLENLHTSLKAVNQGAAIQPHTNRAVVSGEPSQHFNQLHRNISLPGERLPRFFTLSDRFGQNNSLKERVVGPLYHSCSGAIHSWFKGHAEQ